MRSVHMFRPVILEEMVITWTIQRDRIDWRYESPAVTWPWRESSVAASVHAAAAAVTADSTDAWSRCAL